jgi:hypothetical protein
MSIQTFSLSSKDCDSLKEGRSVVIVVDFENKVVRIQTKPEDAFPKMSIFSVDNALIAINSSPLLNGVMVSIPGTTTAETKKKKDTNSEKQSVKKQQHALTSEKDDSQKIDISVGKIVETQKSNMSTSSNSHDKALNNLEKTLGCKFSSDNALEIFKSADQTNRVRISSFLDNMKKSGISDYDEIKNQIDVYKKEQPSNKPKPQTSHLQRAKAFLDERGIVYDKKLGVLKIVALAALNGMGDNGISKLGTANAVKREAAKLNAITTDNTDSEYGLTKEGDLINLEK